MQVKNFMQKKYKKTGLRKIKHFKDAKGQQMKISLDLFVLNKPTEISNIFLWPFYLSIYSKGE